MAITPFASIRQYFIKCANFLRRDSLIFSRKTGIDPTWTSDQVHALSVRRKDVNRSPVEWQQWLRHARADPPTSHDILINDAMRMKTRHRALESDRKHEIWKHQVNNLFTAVF